MSKKVFLTLIIILLVLLLVIFTLYFLTPKKEQVAVTNLNQAATPIPVATPVYTPPAEFAGFVSQEQAIKDNSLLPCLQLTDELARSKCLTEIKNLMMKGASAGFCLTDPDLQNELDCVSEYALRRNQVKECDILPDDGLKNICKEDYALSRVVLGDTQVCDLIVDASIKTSCLDKVYFYQKVNSGNDASCAKITNEPLRNVCESGAY